MTLIGHIALTIFVWGFPILAIVGFAASWRIMMVGGKKFDRECKDFFTSKEVKMLRKLEE